MVSNILFSLVSLSNCSENFGIPDKCKRGFEMFAAMAGSLETACQEWVINTMTFNDTMELQKYQCILRNLFFIYNI